MTATLQPESTSSSRRALLAGAVGGLGAWVAGAMGRPAVVDAHDPQDVLLGGPNTATGTTSITWNSSSDVFAGNSSGSGDVLNGYAASGRGVYGRSDTNTGVLGVSSAADHAGVWGYSGNSGTGVYGSSNAIVLPKAKTGVYGYANQDSNAKGIFGESANGYAGYFLGNVYTSKFHELKEISTPSAPGVNKARLFIRDNGSSKTELCVRFNTGAVKVLATQP